MLFDELKQMNAELEELKKNHLERSKALFTTVAAKVFEAHPALETFSWRQYTPYFNDGEECTFSAHTDYPDINDIDELNFKDKQLIDYSQKDDKGNYSIKKDNAQYNPALHEAFVTVKEFLSNIDDSVLRDMFGDHVEIKVSRNNGVDVQEYEHE